MLLLFFLFDGRENRTFRYLVFLFQIDIPLPCKKKTRFNYFQYQQCFLISATLPATTTVEEKNFKMTQKSKGQESDGKKGGLFLFFFFFFRLNF